MANALRTLSARILIAFAAVILTFGTTTVFIVLFVEDVKIEIAVIREGYLQLALKTKELARSQQDLYSYVVEDRKDEPWRQVQRRLKSYHMGRQRRVEDIAGVLEKLGPVPPRHNRRIREARTALDQIQTAVAAIAPDYARLSSIPTAEADPATPVGLVRKLQQETLLARFQTTEANINRMAQHFAALESSVVSSTARNLERNEERLRNQTIYLGIAATLVGLLVTAWVTISLRPLRRLRDGARRIAAGEYESRIDERGPAEVADLAREFNVMGRAVAERERELVRSERLAAVGKMAAMITHEVRNPLSSIALNTEMLEEDHLAEKDPEARELCRAITREVDRLTALTEEYLAFARLPRPKLVAEQANDVVRALVGFVREDLMARGVTLEVALEPELPLAQLDPAQLRQCLLNLVRNATEAVAGRPKATVKLATRTGDGTVEIEVADNGPGLLPEVQTRLFDPFVSTKQGGTGLGLALTHQIIRDHGGEIRVASQPEQGATFTVVLPRSRMQGPASPGRAATP